MFCIIKKGPLLLFLSVLFFFYMLFIRLSKRGEQEGALTSSLPIRLYRLATLTSFPFTPFFSWANPPSPTFTCCSVNSLGEGFMGRASVLYPHPSHPSVSAFRPFSSIPYFFSCSFLIRLFSLIPLLLFSFYFSFIHFPFLRFFLCLFLLHSLSFLRLFIICFHTSGVSRSSLDSPFSFPITLSFVILVIYFQRLAPSFRTVASSLSCFLSFVFYLSSLASSLCNYLSIFSPSFPSLPLPFSLPCPFLLFSILSLLASLNLPLPPSSFP